jgi:NAD(P)-dependent dehydrogenase (short-subunit alcohol dehydrogenase family)
MDLGLSGKVAFVMGGSSGLGLVIAKVWPVKTGAS